MMRKRNIAPDGAASALGASPLVQKKSFGQRLRGISLGQWVLTIGLMVLSIIMALPLVWMISAAFKYETDIFTYPIQWIPQYLHLDNFRLIFQEFPYGGWYMNTLKVTALVVVFTLVVSAMAAYAFARMEFRGRAILFSLYIATLMIPLEVRIIPQFIFFKELKLLDTHTAVVLPWLFNGFAIFLLRQFFMSIPLDLSSAAKIDGASEFRVFWQIILPLAKPALMALTIITFAWSWNSYMPPLIYINSTAKQLVSVGITTLRSQYIDNYGAQMAGASLALIPVIVVYLCAQKYFVEGVALSGVKG